MAPLALGYVTAPSEAEALRLARHLVERRLVACANILPIRSVYRWEGSIADEAEVVLLIKTRPELFDAAREELLRLHPYQVPCVLRLEADASAAFAAWVAEETAGAG